jgi:hypothetical protein
MKNIGTHFVGMKLFKIAILGIVKFVVNAEIGENGIAKIATGVRMESAFLASIVVKKAGMQIFNKPLQNKSLAGTAGPRSFEYFIIF